MPETEVEKPTTPIIPPDLLKQRLEWESQYKRYMSLLEQENKLLKEIDELRNKRFQLVEDLRKTRTSMSLVADAPRKLIQTAPASLREQAITDKINELYDQKCHLIDIGKDHRSVEQQIKLLIKERESIQDYKFRADAGLQELDDDANGRRTNKKKSTEKRI